MKRNFITFIMVFLFVATANASIDVARYNDCKFDTILDYENVNYNDIANVVYDYVPSGCQDAFLYYTKCDTEEDTFELMIQLLAVGQWESGWKVTVSGENDNGTVDLGYLALNSANAKSDWFMSRFGPNENDGFEYDVNNKNEYYLIACIKFYKYLFERYGENAAYCYNAGEGRYLRKVIPSSTYVYKKRVSEYVGKFIQETVEKTEARLEFEKIIYGYKYVDIAMVQKIYEESFREKFKLIGGKLVRESVLDSTTPSLDETSVFLFTNKNKRMIEAALSVAGLPNTEYVCIGYIRKYGSHLAPVFQSIMTGEKIVC